LPYGQAVMPRDSRTVTGRDVAIAAGVSQATVSLIMSGGGARLGLSVATQAKVREIAAALNYSPNRAAQNLRKRCTRTLTFLTGDLGNRYLGELVAGAEPLAAERGFVVNVVAARTDDAASAVLEHLGSGVSDGVVVHRGFAALRKPIDRLRQRGIAVVLLQDLGLGTAPCVQVDLLGGALVATRHLSGLGHRRVAHITDDILVDPTTNQRLQGYRQGVIEGGLDVDDSLIVAGRNSFEGGAAAVRVLLERCASPNRRPTAIFMFNDHMAIGAMHALDALGLRVPQDIAIVGFDGTDLGAFSKPALTTVEHSHGEQGRRAVAALLEQIDSTHDPEQCRVTLSVKLLVRQSCGATMPS